jgi:DNA-3-methyladenine glycosylase II
MEYIAHLSKDKKFKKILLHQAPIKLARSKEILPYLCRSIMSQQLSTQVAQAIHQRFVDLYQGKPTAERIRDTSFDQLRSIGLSRAKVGYIHNVARFALESGLDYRQLQQMSNEGAITYLTQIKGVGRWTSEVLLIFALGREDVFAADDLGIRQAMMKLYGLEDGDRKLFREQVVSIAAKWSPYRSYACVHLWRWKDTDRDR